MCQYNEKNNQMGNSSSSNTSREEKKPEFDEIEDSDTESIDEPKSTKRRQSSDTESDETTKTQPLQHQNITQKSHADGTESTTSGYSLNSMAIEEELEIQNHIWKYLQYLAQASKTKTDEFQSRTGLIYSNVHNKVLAAFGQCRDIPSFRFNLTIPYLTVTKGCLTGFTKPHRD